MRIFCLLLILANLVLLLLNHDQVGFNKAPPNQYRSEPGVIELELLNEFPVSDVAVQVQDGICIELGPIPSQVMAQRVQDALRKGAFSALISKSEVQNQKRYWVIHGPLPSIEKAEIRLEEFHSKGIDSFIVRSGLIANSISLGTFDNLSAAERSIKRHESSGIQVKIHESEVEKDLFWIGIDAAYTIENNNKIKQIARLQNVLADLRQIFCKNLAST